VVRIERTLLLGELGGRQSVGRVRSQRRATHNQASFISIALERITQLAAFSFAGFQTPDFALFGNVGAQKVRFALYLNVLIIRLKSVDPLQADITPRSDIIVIYCDFDRVRVWIIGS
jgi:hypothetical protein